MSLFLSISLNFLFLLEKIVLFWMLQEMVGYTAQNSRQALSSSKGVGSGGGRSKGLFLRSATLGGVF